MYNAAVGGKVDQPTKAPYAMASPAGKAANVAPVEVPAAPMEVPAAPWGLEPPAAKPVLMEVKTNSAPEEKPEEPVMQKPVMEKAAPANFEGFMNSSECPRPMRGPSTRINAPPGGHSTISFG
jgi:hypothetical protein